MIRLLMGDSSIRRALRNDASYRTTCEMFALNPQWKEPRVFLSWYHTVVERRTEKRFSKEKLMTIFASDVRKLKAKLDSSHIRGNELHGLPRKHLADRLLNGIEAWIPIPHREELIGDLREDVTAKRAEGWKERKLRRLIWWQVGCAVVERLKPWKWFKPDALFKIVVERKDSD